MSKYEPLRRLLANHPKTMWSGQFADLERVLASSLPPSARRHRPWWANQTGQGHVQAHAWMDEGWRVQRVDLQRQEVEFVRSAQPVETSTSDDDGLYAQAAELTGIADRNRLTSLALEALIEREAIAYLAALGGTMPDAEAPERRRPA